MNSYVLLLRGINVGGKNKIPMAQLKTFLEEQGCTNVLTYIQSGNAVLQSALSASELQKKLEENIMPALKLSTSPIKMLVLTPEQMQSVVDHKPKDFGDHPDTYYSDVIFLMDISVDQTMPVFSPREGVDTIWPGKGVIYSRRLSAERTKSRLNKIMTSPLYKSMTIRNWNTTLKMLELVKNLGN